jgi:hypothetical protein
MISALIFIRYTEGVCIVILAYEYFATTSGKCNIYTGRWKDCLLSHYGAINSLPRCNGKIILINVMLMYFFAQDFSGIIF